MKKLLVSMLVVALCVPAMAATTVEAVGGDAVMTITVTVTDDDVVRGLAVTVEQAAADTGDAEIALVTGDFDVDASSFNTFIDFAYSAESGYTAVGQGHPIAVVDAAGEIAPATGVQNFAFSAGYLDDEGGEQAGLGVGVYTITINMDCNATTVFDVALDSLRGGIVGDDLEVTDSLTTVTVNPGVSECISSSAPFYADWVALGSPPCWCYERNCNGDANGEAIVHPVLGTTYVTTADLNILILGWGVKEQPKGIGVVAAGGVCADFNREAIVHPVLGTTRVTTDDLNKLIAAWNVKEPPKGVGVPVCPLVGAGGDINFYMYP